MLLEPFAEVVTAAASVVAVAVAAVVRGGGGGGCLTRSSCQLLGSIEHLLEHLLARKRLGEPELAFCAAVSAWPSASASRAVPCSDATGHGDGKPLGAAQTHLRSLILGTREGSSTSVRSCMAALRVYRVGAGDIFMRYSRIS